MRIIRGSNVTYYISKEIARELEQDVRWRDEHSLVEKIVKNSGISHSGHVKGAISPEQKNYLDLWAQFRGVNNLGFLDAHGNSDGKNWLFTDDPNKPDKSVREWVLRNEKNHHALFLSVCNPRACEIETKKAILIYPSSDSFAYGDGRVFGDGDIHGMTTYNFYVPKIGFINDYVVDYETKELQKRLDQNTVKS
mgnify:CR=1 FL=1